MARRRSTGIDWRPPKLAKTPHDNWKLPSPKPGEKEAAEQRGIEHMNDPLREDFRWRRLDGSIPVGENDEG